MKKLLIAALLLCLTSCATITNSRTYPLRVSTNAKNASVKVYDSVYKLPTEVEVTRSNKPLQVTLTYDTIVRDYTVKSKIMSKTSLDNIIFFGFYPEALLVDVLTKKGYYYGDELFMDIYDTLPEAKRIISSRKKHITYEENSFNINISIPYANIFLLQPESEGIKKGGGFFGLTLGAEYFYKKNKYVKLNAGGIVSFPIPFPVPLINDGEVETLVSLYSTLTDNYQLNRFSLGYGFSYSFYRYDHNFGDDNYTNQKDKSVKGHGIGLSFNTYYRLGRRFNIGFVYNPTFISIYPQTELLYQHTISFDLLWRIPI